MRHLFTFEPGYSDIGLCDISSIASYILWYELIKLINTFTVNMYENFQL